MYQVQRLIPEVDTLRAAVAQARPYRPLMVKIKLLWACNLSCEMCDYWRMGGSQALAYEQVTRLLDELAGLGCQKVHFSGGEPMLRSDLVDIITYARKLKLRVTLTTNGTLLDRKLGKALVKAGLNRMCVSIDSPSRRVHDWMRGRDGAFKATIRGIKEFQQAVNERGVSLPVQVNTVVSRENYASLAGLPDFVHELGAKSILLMPVDDPSGELLLNRRRLQDFNQRIAPAFADRALVLGLIKNKMEAFPFGLSPNEVSESRQGNYAHSFYAGHPCYAPWIHTLVTADGRVAPCCSAPRFTLGDIHRQSIGEIWSGEAYQQLRANMREGRPLPHCAGCDVFLAENRLLFQLCRGN
jgi:radical SAM protein with 4Fe4S-binding SPASM domain